MIQKPVKTALFALLAGFSASLSAAPTAYSINSDSASANADSLYRIDLATGAETRIGFVKSLGSLRIDVEGLAFAPDGTLYGVDDETLKLFPINPDNGQVQTTSEVDVDGVPNVGKHDFGMTFSCDGTLYLSSVRTQSLYRVGLDGTASLVGNAGSLGVNISALAAYGDKLYGLGNGLKLVNDNPVKDNPSLYSIDTGTGAATRIGTEIGADPYSEGGLAFDDSGTLWAITDRRTQNLPSQVMQIDITTGLGSAVQATKEEQGFESLAITVPRGCEGGGGSEGVARFSVQKQFVDGNDVTPATLRIECNTGVPLKQELTVNPNDGPFGQYEVEFVVREISEGELQCQVFEDTPPGYTPSYQCFSEAQCSVDADACTFSEVFSGQEHLCLVRNRPAPVEVTVNKEWVVFGEELPVDHRAVVHLFCDNVFDGDGEFEQDGTMHWWWYVPPPNSSHTATVYPAFDGSTRCRTAERVASSAVESTSDCGEGIRVPLGAGARACTITNTVFFEGIPTLSRYGLLLVTALVLVTGTFAARRI